MLRRHEPTNGLTMPIVRFRQTFRERAPEWIMAYVQAGWGSTLLLSGDVFS